MLGAVAVQSAQAPCKGWKKRPSNSPTSKCGVRCASRVAGGRAQRLEVVARSAGKETGGNVLDRPSIAPGKEIGRETRRKRPPSYRVLLHNDTYNRREYVVSVLLKVVPGTTVDDAVNIMQEAHLNGLALVTQCAQDQAEQYCESLRTNGLIATIEPAGGGGSGSGGSGSDTPST